MCEKCGVDHGDNILSELMQSYTAFTESSGYLVVVVDMDGRPWEVISACRDESGVDTVAMLTQEVMDKVAEHWPMDDKVKQFIWNTPEDTKKNIAMKKQEVAKHNFNNIPIKN